MFSIIRILLGIFLPGPVGLLISCLLRGNFNIDFYGMFLSLFVLTIPATIYSLIMEFIGSRKFRAKEDLNLGNSFFFLVWSTGLGFLSGLALDRFLPRMEFIYSGIGVGLSVGIVLLIMWIYAVRTDQGPPPD